MKNCSIKILPATSTGIIYGPSNINLRPFERIKQDDFINDYNLQFIEAITGIQSAISRIKNSENTAIIFISTVVVQIGLLFHSQESISKEAVVELTKALAAEYAPNISVIAVAPFLITTPLESELLNNETKKVANAKRHPLKIFSKTDDIFYIFIFLLSSMTRWITEQILHVYAGISISKP